MSHVPAPPARHLAGTVWSRGVRLRPAEAYAPRDEDQVLSVLAHARASGLPVRVIGGGHSFSPLVATDGILLTLDDYQGLISADRTSGRVRLCGGTRLWRIGDLLAPHGLALENMGDIDHQSIAGAISTATHGTGAAFTGFSAQVRGLRLALADGTVVDVDREHDWDLFEAARAGLGAYGVILEVELQTVPAFRLQAADSTEPLDPVVRTFLSSCETIDHQEFYWFVGTGRATVRRSRRLPADAPRSRPHPARELFEREVLSNGAWEVLCRVGAAAPPLRAPIAEIASRLFAGPPMTDDAARVFTAPRRVRFRESEWALDVADFEQAFATLRNRLQAEGVHVTFPLEIRRAAADDVWLSTASGRETVYIAAHQYHRQDAVPYLRLVQETLAPFGARPHWGKLHWLDAERLRPLYPRFEDACAVRRQADPDGLFLTPYLRSILGF